MIIYARVEKWTYLSLVSFFIIKQEVMSKKICSMNPLIKLLQQLENVAKTFDTPTHTRPNFFFKSFRNPLILKLGPSANN